MERISPAGIALRGSEIRKLLVKAPPVTAQIRSFIVILGVIPHIKYRIDRG